MRAAAMAMSATGSASKGWESYHSQTRTVAAHQGALTFIAFELVCDGLQQSHFLVLDGFRRHGEEAELEPKVTVSAEAIPPAM
jgi:hypothetical protein